MTKHTPGPWSAQRDDQMINGHAYPKICAEIVSADGGPVAQVYGSDDEAVANADVIAVAPELLHFAKWAQQVCDGPIPLDDVNLRLAVSRLAAELIAKAEGR